MLLPNYLGGLHDVFVKKLFIELNQDSMKFDHHFGH